MLEPAILVKSAYLLGGGFWYYRDLFLMYCTPVEFKRVEVSPIPFILKIIYFKFFIFRVHSFIVYLNPSTLRPSMAELYALQYGVH